MKERLKELRKALGLTQQEMADSIGIKRNTIANYETGRNEPVDAIFSLLCRTYNVNEDWLKYGTGQMFVELSEDEEIARYMGELLRDEKPDFRRRFIAALLKIPREDWVVLERIVKTIAEETKKTDSE